MKFIPRIIAACLLVSSITAASATDLYRQVQYPKQFSWTGFGVGIYGGKATGTSADSYEYNFPGWGTFRNDNTFDMKGALFGARAEGMYQWNRFVLGGFMDFGKSTLKGTKDLAPGFYGFSDTLETRLKWIASAGLTAGFAITERTLLYGLGGGAYGVLSACERVSTTGYSSTNCNDYGSVGPTWGAGIKYAPLDNLILGVEYRWTGLKALSTTNEDSFGYRYTRDIKANTDTVLGYVLYKFNL